MTHSTNFPTALAALATAALLSCGCSTDGGGNTPAPSACSDPTQVSLPTCSVAGMDPFSDEACQYFDDRLRQSPPVANDARAAAVLAPAEGERVPAAAPYAFRWSAPTARLQWHPMTFRDELARWTTLVPEAEAHCAPFNGRGYELVFRAGGRTILRRQQSAASWTPDAGAWSRIVAGAAGSAVELTVLTTQFTNSQIGSNVVYTQAAPRRFTISTM